MSAKTVFISYRRDSTGKLFARLLAEGLTRLGYDVFLDVDSLDRYADENTKRRQQHPTRDARAGTPPAGALQKWID